MILNLFSYAASHAPQRRGLRRINACLAGRRINNIHFPISHLNHGAQAKLWLGFADPTLSFTKAIHFYGLVSARLRCGLSALRLSNANTVGIKILAMRINR